MNVQNIVILVLVALLLAVLASVVIGEPAGIITFIVILLLGLVSGRLRI